MLRAYFETQFLIDELTTPWPAEFAIISAYATTGQRWTAEKNQAADLKLESSLRRQRAWHKRVIGTSPTSSHAEPSWAVALDFAKACDLGLRFLQEAIYYVEGDLLWVSYSDNRRQLIRVGSFRQRLVRH